MGSSRSSAGRRGAWRAALSALAVLFATACTSGMAATLSVKSNAPSPLDALLQQNITLTRATESLDNAERIRLARLAVKQATDLLATEGYFASVVSVDTIESETITLEVNLGTRTTISKLDIVFQGDIAEADPSRISHAIEPSRNQRMQSLRDAWSLKITTPFRQADWSAAKDKLLQDLQATDYAGAVMVESAAEIDVETATAVLRVVVESGPPYTFGALEVSGLTQYDMSLISRYVRWHEGEPYRQERLLEVQRTLQNTPYFSSVLVDIERNPARHRNVPVSIRLSENPAKRVSFTAGVSSNSGARGEAMYRNANLFNRAWLLTVGARADRVASLGYADIYLPPRTTDYRDSVGVLTERVDNRGLVTYRTSWGAVRTRTRGDIETRLALNFQRERRDVQFDDGVRQGKRDALALAWGWNWRNVDNVLDPRQGQTFAIQLGGASRALLSDRDFFRTYVRAQQYWTVRKTDVLTVRVEAGLTAARDRDGIPEEYLFRTGGAQSIRGYQYQSIGVQEGNAIVGGRFLLVGSAEYTHWFLPLWGAAVFVDAGRASDSFKTASPAYRSAGIGARWRSPAGPLAFDLAYAERDRKVRPAFSIAIAF